MFLAVASANLLKQSVKIFKEGILPQEGKPRRRDLTYLLTYLVTYLHTFQLLTPWVFGPLRVLVSFLTDAHSSLSTAFCRHFLTISLLYIFQFSQSRSSPSSTSFHLTLKYFLNCRSQIHSCYMSSPFQSLLSKPRCYVYIFIQLPQFLISTYSPYSLLSHWPIYPS